MRLIGLALVICAIASSASAGPLPSPIAQASSGKLQCYAPNRFTKSCQSLAAYQSRPDGGIVNPATVLISASPLITMRTVTPVTIKANQVCGFIRPEDIEAAEFTISGNPATPAQTTILRQQIAVAQKGIFGHEICTAYVPEADAFIAKVSIDGTAEPNSSQQVLWVSPEDGFKVQP